MKLLFDQNLSPKLADRLSDLFPDSVHVMHVGLDCASDTQVWEFAKHTGMTIVSKDADFNDLNVLHGLPPKVIWIVAGNCSTSRLEAILRSNEAEIRVFEADDSLGTLVLS